MTSSVTLKLVLPDKTLRRITVAGDVTFESFQVLAKRIAGVDPVFLAFQDEDGDFITLASSAELAEFLNDSGAGKVKKLFISAQPVAQESPAAAAAQEAAEEAEPVDERSPLERLASALAKPDTVRELQKALGESPVVVDAITGVANAFLTAGLPGAFAAGKDQIPLVVAVAEEAAARDPELDAAVKDLRRQHEDGEQNGEPWFAGLHRHHPMAAFMGPFLGGAWHHGFGGHHPCGGPAAAAASNQAATPTDKPVHAFVVCDGCDNDADLKARAKAAGTISMRGWILGDRFKSQTVPDFDLCETCNATGRFAGYGPFENVPPRFGGRGGCGGGQFRCGGPGRHAHAHAHAHAQQQQRGCRGSRKNAFAEVLAETIKSVTEAVAESANEDSEVAQIARAVRDSLLSANAKPQAQAQQQQQQPAAAAAAAAKPAVPPAKPAVPPAKPVVVPEAPNVPVAAPAEDPVDATWEHVDPMVKWSAQLQKLHALGFTDVETYIPMLEEEQGDLEKVVNRIIRRNA